MAGEAYAASSPEIVAQRASISQNALALLRFEGELRDCPNLSAARFFISNETGKLLRAQQGFLFEVSELGSWQLSSITGVPAVDINVPLNSGLRKLVARLARETSLAEVTELRLDAYANEVDPALSSYPLQEALWIPVVSQHAAVCGGLLITRQEPWSGTEHGLARRLSSAISQAWIWQASKHKSTKRYWPKSRKISAAGVALICSGFIPVPLTTLAPLEIVPSQQTVITAPIDGVIADIPISANTLVQEGDLLVRFDDTSLRNRFEVAEREVYVAEANTKKTMLMAVDDINGRHQLAISQAELAVKSAERDYARTLLERSTVFSKHGGIAVFGDKRELIGKPVATGEKLLAVADPSHVEIRADVPISDTIMLAAGSRVKAYLDSDPLHPIEAVLTYAEYQPRLRESGILAFRMTAAMVETGQKAPRLGSRGTAQIFGENVTLAYYLFRRPIAAARQWLGL